MALAILVAFGLASCAGHGSSAPGAVPSAAPSVAMGEATVTITVPSAATSAASARRPAYVSPSAQSISISSYAVVAGVIAGTAAATSNQNLTATTPGCSASVPIVCSVTVAAPIGTAAFSVTVYQGLGQTGVVLSSLPQSSATERTISEGAGNVVLPLILGGVPATIVVSLPQTSFTGGVSASVPTSVVASDAAGNVIVGAAPYANAITLTDSDSSGATSFSPSTVTSPTTNVVLNYNGNGFTSPATVSATAPGASANSSTLTFVNGPLVVACSSGCSGLTNGSTPYAETISEGGYGSGTFTLSGGGSECTFDPATSVTASGGSATVHIYPNPTGGTCTLAVSDTNAQSATATVSFNAAAQPTVIGNCGYSFPPPTDPNGGTLYIFDGCVNATVQYGSYLFVPFQSNQNPESFQIAAYANPSEAALTQFQVGGNRYITGATISSPNVVFAGQAGNSSIPFTLFVP